MLLLPSEPPRKALWGDAWGRAGLACAWHTGSTQFRLTTGDILWWSVLHQWKLRQSKVLLRWGGTPPLLNPTLRKSWIPQGLDTYCNGWTLSLGQPFLSVPSSLGILASQQRWPPPYLSSPSVEKDYLTTPFFGPRLMSVPRAEGSPHPSHTLCKGIHTSLHSWVWPPGQTAFPKEQSDSQVASDVPVVTVQTGIEEQQREQLLGQGDSLELEGVPTLKLCGLYVHPRLTGATRHQKWRVLGRKWGPVNDFEQLEVQSWKVPQEEICLSLCSGGFRPRAEPRRARS